MENNRLKGADLVPTTENNCGINTRADSEVGREILSEGYPIMRIDITGYVTEPLVSYQFTIKVTSDSVECLSLSNLQVSKEVRISIPLNFIRLTTNL